MKICRTIKRIVISQQTNEIENSSFYKRRKHLTKYLTLITSSKYLTLITFILHYLSFIYFSMLLCIYFVLEMLGRYCHCEHLEDENDFVTRYEHGDWYDESELVAINMALRNIVCNLDE